jgi:hypothetical protein
LASEGKAPDKVWAMPENPTKNTENRRIRLLFIRG